VTDSDCDTSKLLKCLYDHRRCECENSRIWNGSYCGKFYFILCLFKNQTIIISNNFKLQKLLKEQRVILVRIVQLLYVQLLIADVQQATIGTEASAVNNLRLLFKTVIIYYY